MTDPQLATINDKLLTLLRDLTLRQAEWIQSLQTHIFNPAVPEDGVFLLIAEALAAGIRSSTARLLVEDRLRANGIEFSAQKMNAKAFAARAHWENLGTAKHPAPPPFE